MAAGRQRLAPWGAGVRELPAEEGADLFPALLKARAHKRLEVFRENHRVGLSHQVQQVGFDVGPRIKTGGGDFMTRSKIVGGLKKNRDGAKGL